MIFKWWISFSLILLLAGCGGGGGGSSVEEGTNVTLTAQVKPYNILQAGHTFYNREGIKITLKKAYLTLWSVRLSTDCTQPGYVQWGEKILAWLIQDSQAHAVSAPTLLGVPSILNLLDSQIVMLGKLNPPPASYCGTELNFLKADSDSQYLPSEITMVNRSLYLEGEYIPLGSTQALSFSVDTSKALLPRLLKFPVPMILSSTQRNATINLSIAYDTWFDGLDLGMLSTDDTQQNLLFYNLIQSIQKL